MLTNPLGQTPPDAGVPEAQPKPHQPCFSSSLVTQA